MNDSAFLSSTPATLLSISCHTEPLSMHRYKKFVQNEYSTFSFVCVISLCFLIRPSFHHLGHRAGYLYITCRLFLPQKIRAFIEDQFDSLRVKNITGIEPVCLYCLCSNFLSRTLDHPPWTSVDFSSRPSSVHASPSHSSTE